MAGDKNEINTKTEGVLDASSPLYIHPSDYPKQLHVNDNLTDSSYVDWSQEILNFLFAKNKVGLIDGTLKKPYKTAIDFMAWMHADAMVKGWLITAMEKDNRSSVKYVSTSIWNDLLKRFCKQSAPRANGLKQSLATMRKDGSSISLYYTRLRSLWDEIHSVLRTPMHL
ncbi:uncharacterized protein LOC110869765 [Helianthus annuus]|uniref:uncharacterized protein LOC110869765 n=1 Tax=Helianthus annuus TaxID=4232 RepID=UPI000B901169|nr:uncharacterized protein LOC110869765 [Helianthus annuus]